MLRPMVTSPADLEFQSGTTGHNLVWDGSNWSPASYNVTVNSTAAATGAWDGSPVVYSLDDLEQGTWIVTITLVDSLGETVSDTVVVTVTQASLFGNLDNNMLILIAAAALFRIILAVICSKQKSGTTKNAKPRPRKKKK